MLPEVPTTSAKVLVAFATTGGVPQNSRVGKVTRVPPPATAFMAPPTAAESISVMISAGAMEESGAVGFPDRPAQFGRHRSWIVVAFVWGWSKHVASNFG